ncbi:MAG: pilus assembly protein [Candidatus Riflebacteria bacterium]|nr:pilus assembly protein [Candidatus Riflebacteria bacterium]
MKRSRFGSCKKGQGMVELAFVFPIFILILMAIFDFGRAFHLYSTLSHQTYSAARVAAMRQNPFVGAGTFGVNTHTSLTEVQSAFLMFKSPLMTDVSSATISDFVSFSGVGEATDTVRITASYPVEMYFPLFYPLWQWSSGRTDTASAANIILVAYAEEQKE